MIKKRNFKSIVAVGVITLASATLLAACGSKSTSSKDEINWYTPTEILTLDISKNTDHYFVLIKMGSCNLIWLKRLMYQLMV